MKIYSQYIILSLLKSFALLITVISTVIILIQFLSMASRYPGFSIGLGKVLVFVLLSLPSVFVYLSPVITGCAIIYVFHSLIISNEIIILESSGVSQFNLALSAFTFTLALTAVMYFVIMIVEPLSKRELYRYKKNLSNAVFTSILEEQSFNKISPNIILYLNKKNTYRALEGIILFDNKKDGKETVICAEQAQIEDIQDVSTITLLNGSRQEVAKHNLQVLKFDMLSFPLYAKNSTDDKTNVISVGRQFMSDLIVNSSSSLAAFDELHHRFAYPLCNIVVAAISLAAVFYGQYSRKWTSRKIWFALLFNICAMTIILLLKSRLVFGLPWLTSLYFSIFIFIIAPLLRLKMSSENMASSLKRGA